MKQAIIKKGKVISDNIPPPQLRARHILIKVVNSCISAGTEASGVKLSGQNIVKRALQQPENVRKVIESVKAEGLSNALSKTKRKLSEGNPTGYSISGIVAGVGEGVNGFQVGDRVAAAGAGLANHAEYVNIPEKLAVKLPASLDFVKASTITLGAIALQGVRRADLKLGEYCVVFGTGILGLLSVQFLVASGVRVAAVDLDEKRLTLAKEFGAEIIINPSTQDLLLEANNWTENKGADAVLFTAATDSSEPLSQSFQLCKKKGKVVLVGVVGMEIERADIYVKELDFEISTSYGPGRYDAQYEEKGIDYPYAYVRWTENRNMKEYLRLLSQSEVNIDKLLNKSFSIDDVTLAFESLNNSEEKPLMVILNYGHEVDQIATKVSTQDGQINQKIKKSNTGKINVGLIGAGGFGTGVHLPNLNRLKDKYSIHAIADINGVQAKNAATNFNAQYSTTNINELIDDDDIQLVIITTSHKSHGEIVLNALNKGRNVMVEKPLTISLEELDKIKAFYQSGIQNKPLLFVGYNRRFSKYAQEIESKVRSRFSPLVINYRMNAGHIPLDHWVHEEGGRIIGETCHIIDLMTFLTGCSITSCSFESMNPTTEKFTGDDNKSIILKYADGSICNIQYFSVGSKELSKEYMEIHYDGKSIIMEDYKSLKGYGQKIHEYKDKRGDKGHFSELVMLYEFLAGKTTDWPIAYWDLVQTSEISIGIATS
jgi:predicted dehydrogenase/threonine dehydrogenase-like Zn-dependent dehydrogenase